MGTLYLLGGGGGGIREINTSNITKEETGEGGPLGVGTPSCAC